MASFVENPDGTITYSFPMLIGGAVDSAVKQKAIDNVKYIFANYVQEGNSINTTFLDVGNDSGMFVNGAMPTLPVIGEPEYYNNLTVEDITVDVTGKNTTVQNSLLGRLKENQESTNSRIDKQNALLEKKNTLMVESNKIEAMKVDELRKQTIAIDALTKAVSVGVLDKQTEIARNNYVNQSTIVKNQSDISKNNAIWEHHKYQKDGDSNLKNSKGDIIKPREEQAKYHSEKRIDEERANTTDLSGMLNSLDADLNNPNLDIDIMTDVLEKMVDSVDATKVDTNGREQ